MPTEYYDNNVAGTAHLLKAMLATNVKTLEFSRSTTVYGEPKYLLIDEAHPTSATAATTCKLKRYLPMSRNPKQSGRAPTALHQPGGAHDSGLIGENPNDTPNNLMLYIAMVARGKLPRLNVFSHNYDT